MKIEGSAPLRTTTGAQRAKSRDGAGGAFRVDSGADEAPTAGVSSAGPTLAVASLLSLQEAPSSTEGRSRGLRRGRDLLDQLDRIRLALLTGEIPVARLDGLMRQLKQARSETGDPGLDEILAEIELRCAVELAKFETLRGSASNAA
jgi:hypothetical protein